MRLIDADRFRSAMWYAFGEQDKYFEKGMAKWDSGLWVRYKAVEEVLDSQPTIEAEPIRYGRWIVNNETKEWEIVYCDQCHEGMWNRKGDPYPNYCYNCGAKMDEVEE